MLLTKIKFRFFHFRLTALKSVHKSHESNCSRNHEKIKTKITYTHTQTNLHGIRTMPNNNQ